MDIINASFPLDANSISLDFGPYSEEVLCSSATLLSTSIPEAGFLFVRLVGSPVTINLYNVILVISFL